MTLYAATPPSRPTGGPTLTSTRDPHPHVLQDPPAAETAAALAAAATEPPAAAHVATCALEPYTPTR